MQPTDFYGPAIKMTADALYQAANRLGVEVEVLQALMYKETHDQAFLPDGRPSILFEPLVFHHLTGGEFDDDHPELSVKDSAHIHYGPGGFHQYDKLYAAMALNEKMALQSCSWGFWQCMGYNYREAGYTDVYEMVKAFVAGEPAQLNAFCNYLTVRGFIPALKTKDWATIAFKYNGPNYRKNNYDTDLAKFYEQAKSSVVRIGSTGPQVVKVEQLLILYNPKGGVTVDGVFGEEDAEVLRDFQRKAGITPDGICGPQTLTALASERLAVTSPSQSKRIAGAVVAGGMGVGGVMPLSDVADVASKVEEGTKLAQKLTDTNHPAAATAVVQHNVVQASDALHKAQWIIGFESVALVVLAVYIIWTKFADWKKQKGVKNIKLR